MKMSRKVLVKKLLILCATYFFNKTDQILFNVAFPHISIAHLTNALVRISRIAGNPVGEAACPGELRAGG